MGKFHGLGLGSFKPPEQSKQQSSAASRNGSTCASPVSTASINTANMAPAGTATAAAAAAPSMSPLTLGHQHAAGAKQEQQFLPHMVADVVTEEADKLSVPIAVVSRLHVANSDNGSGTGKQHHDVHGPLPQAQLQYSNLAGKMLRMVNELRATGADVSLELPTIVVCGQQSAGKSSVVENICGIPLPRAADTCTRCPTEVRLSQQPPSNGLLWEATVKLRREHSLGARAALFHQASSNSSQHNNNSNAANASNNNNMFSPMSAGRHPSHTGTINSSSSGSKAGGSLYPAVPGSPSAQGMQQQQPQQLPVQQQLEHQHQQQQQQQQQHEVYLADPHTMEAVFKSGIARPEDLPAVVSAAQACLLNSSSSRRNAQHTGSFGHHTGGTGSPAAAAAEAALKTGDPTTGHGAYGGLKFSRDVVIVEVAGAPVDLTLIDLPGIIHNVERPEDEHYKLLVTDLAERYMRRPGTVIVATITCTADIDTQGVLSMAREADPKGLRTLGVLTKPDQVEEGCHGQWLQVLQGKRYPLQLGWYVVKNPNQAALLRGTSSVAARQQEDMFFESSAPWGRLSSDQKSRLGTLRLREAMSKQLVKMAATARPTLMAAAQEQLVALRAELASLPPAAVLGDGHAEMLRLIDDVSANIQEEVLARSQSKQFYQHLITLYQQLKSRLVNSRPCFLLPRGGGNSSSNNSSSLGFLAVTCALDDDLVHADEAYLCSHQQQAVNMSLVSEASCLPRNSDGGNSPQAANRLGSYNIFSASTPGNPGGKPGLGVFVAGGGSSSSSTINGVSPAGASSAPAFVVAAGPHQVLLPADAMEAQRGLTLDDVRQLVERHHSIELPGFSPYSAVQELVSRHQTSWAAAAADCVAAAHRQLLQLVLLHVARTFSRFPAAADHIRDLATELLEELNSETTSAVDSLVAMEMSGTLFAVSRREFSRASSQHLEGLRMLLNTTSTTSSIGAGPAAGRAEAGGGGSNAAAASSTGNPAENSSTGIRQLPAGSALQGHLHTGLYDAALLSQGIVLPPIPATATGTPELLSMIAAALSYYALACRRLSDTVSMSVMHHLVTAFTTRFRSRLATALLNLSSESVGSMLVEDEASAARRASLTARKDMLEQAMKVMRAAV